MLQMCMSKVFALKGLFFIISIAGIHILVSTRAKIPSWAP